LKITRSYFSGPEPDYWGPDNWEQPKGDYAEPNAEVTHGSYEWTHSLGSIINALIGVGLRLGFLHEFPVLFFGNYPFMKKDEDGWWRLESDKVPLTFSLKAFKV